MELQRQLLEVKASREINRDMHEVANQRIIKLTEVVDKTRTTHELTDMRVNMATESVNQLRAEFDALLVREVEMKEKVAERS